MISPNDSDFAASSPRDSSETVIVTVTLGSDHERVFTSTLSTEYVNELRESLAGDRTTMIPLRETLGGVAGGCVMISQMHLKPEPWSSGTYEPRRRTKTIVGRVLRKKIR